MNEWYMVEANKNAEGIIWCDYYPVTYRPIIATYL